MLDAYRDMGFGEYQRHIREAMNAATRTDRPPPRASGSFDELVERRGRLLGSAIAPLTYDRPLHLVRGRGAWLYDADGRAYLDCYNNVPVVGHAHPHVVEAIARQAATLNTNARYLYGSALELAERLIATMPDGLDTVMLVNSGSEANDLAWRLATTVTGGTGGVVTEFAYHGVTTAIADLSPEEWKRGIAPPNIATVPAPDGYRGPHRREEPGWAARYAAHVDDAIAELDARGVRPAAMVVDSGFTSDGIFTPPAEYLQDAVRRWRDAGGLFVADEVQSGFGRPGLAPVGVRRARRDPRHRHVGEADGERPSGRRGDHARRHRRPIRARDGVVQHVRRQPRRVRGVAGRARRDRTGARAVQRGGTRRLDPRSPRRAHDPARA